jgi:hypothetical protein
VTEQHVIKLNTIRKLCEPTDVGGVEHTLMALGCNARSSVKPLRAQAPRAGGIVITQHNEVCKVADDLTALIRVSAVPDGIT